MTVDIGKDCGPSLKEFKAKIAENTEVKAKITSLKKEVEEFAMQFPLPGFDNW